MARHIGPGTAAARRDLRMGRRAGAGEARRANKGRAGARAARGEAHREAADLACAPPCCMRSRRFGGPRRGGRTPKRASTVEPATVSFAFKPEAALRVAHDAPNTLVDTGRRGCCGGAVDRRVWAGFPFPCRTRARLHPRSHTERLGAEGVRHRRSQRRDRDDRTRWNNRRDTEWRRHRHVPAVSVPGAAAGRPLNHGDGGRKWGPPGRKNHLAFRPRSARGGEWPLRDVFGGHPLCKRTTQR